MASLSSVFSKTVTSQIPSYTTPFLVSKAAGDEVLEEEVLSDWIQQAREEIDRQTGMSFLSLIFTEEADGSGLPTLFTRRFPVLEISKVMIDGVELAPSTYAVNLRTGSVTLRNSTFPEGIKNVTITGIYGYRQVPPLVQKIATILAAKTALSAKNGPLVDNESIGDFTQTRTFKKLNDELDRAWKSLGKKFPVDFV
jgi:hypothetical protein